MTETEILRREFGNLIRSAREGKNLSQDGLAKLMEMERQQIYRIENGLSGTKQETARKFAEVLDLDANELMAFAAGIRPKNSSTLPDPLKISDFDGFDEGDIKDIKNYIDYKKSLKQKQ